MYLHTNNPLYYALASATANRNDKNLLELARANLSSFLQETREAVSSYIVGTTQETGSVQTLGWMLHTINIGSVYVSLRCLDVEKRPYPSFNHYRLRTNRINMVHGSIVFADEVFLLQAAILPTTPDRPLVSWGITIEAGPAVNTDLEQHLASTLFLKGYRNLDIRYYTNGILSEDA